MPRSIGPAHRQPLKEPPRKKQCKVLLIAELLPQVLSRIARGHVCSFKPGIVAQATSKIGACQQHIMQVRLLSSDSLELTLLTYRGRLKPQNTGCGCGIKHSFVTVFACTVKQAGLKQETDLVMRKTLTVVTFSRGCYSIVWYMCTKGSHTVGDITVACDPATVSCTPVHVIWLGIKDILGGQGRPYHVPPRGVLHPLGLAC